MSIVKQYADYLRDNPKGYWFKRKLYGWGWVPARWEGWAVLGVFLVYVTWTAVWFAHKTKYGVASNVEAVAFFIKIAIAVALLIYLCYLKGEKPRWQWGIPND